MVDVAISTRAGAGTVPPNDAYYVVSSGLVAPYVALVGAPPAANGSMPVSSAGTLGAEQALSIANGASVTTGQVDLAGVTPVALWTPAAWTAAAITFQASRDGGSNWGDVFDDFGAEVTIPSAAIPIAAIRRFSLNPRIFLGALLIRVRSGTSAAPVNQGGVRAITLVTRAIL